MERGGRGDKEKGDGAYKGETRARSRGSNRAGDPSLKIS